MLKDKNHIKTIITAAIANVNISFLVIESTSPVKYPVYLENPPLADKITIPMAMPADEKTPIMVSAEETLDSIMVDIPSANMIANAIMETA